MLRRLILVALCLVCSQLLGTLPVAAQTARVTGGEHADFTRLVVEARGATDWRFGRVADGYELDMGDLVTGFDVTEAFQKIPRDRITALWRDPETGRLRFSLNCACHALAFEFRPGIVVIDIRAGAAPEGSAFEGALDPPPPETAISPPDDPPPVADVAPAPVYDWLEIARNDPDPSAPRLDLPLPTGDISLDPLRDALLTQISRGAAEGVVEVAETGPLPPPGAGAAEDGPWMRISVGELPGLAVGPDRPAPGSLTANGRACLADADLAVADWGLAGPIAAQIGLGRSGMLTEFDVPVPDAILRSAQFHIFLGFGAEAQQYLQMLQGKPDDKTLILQAMARIVDEVPPENGAFDDMEACESAAALWATLARRGQPLAPTTNSAAVAGHFAALPPHLRRHLGGALVDLFTTAGDVEAARRIRDAMLRVPAEGDPKVELMEARYQLAEGEQDAARTLAEGVLAEGGPGAAEAAATLIEAAFSGDRRIDPKLPLALDSFLHNARGTAQEADLLRARVLAAAMVSDFPTAFALIDQVPDSFTDLWSMAATEASDDVFLDQASRFAARRPFVAAETVRKVAERLSTLGFPDLTLNWLGPVTGADPEDLRLLAAQARLSLRDAPGTLALLAGLGSPEALRLSSDARLQLGLTAVAADDMIRAGATEAGQRALTWTQDWARIGAEGPEVWRKAAGLVTAPDTVPGAGPITRGTALVEESAAARAVIGDLLLGLSSPPPGP